MSDARRRTTLGPATSAAIPILWALLAKHGTQTRLAAHLDENDACVSRLLYGVRRPGRALSLKLRDFGVPVERWEEALPEGWALPPVPHDIGAAAAAQPTSERPAHLRRIGAKLRKWRDSKCLTQGVAASHVSASQVAWSSWEAGTRAPDLHSAFALERLTDGDITSAEWAFPRSGSRAEQPGSHVHKRAPSLVGVRLKEARAHVVDLTARELDRIANTTEGHVSLIESGVVKNITIDTAAGLAYALGVTVDWLSGGDGEAPSADTVRAAVEIARESWAAKRSAQTGPQPRVVRAVEANPAEPIRHTVAGIWCVTIPASDYDALRDRVAASPGSIEASDVSHGHLASVELDNPRGVSVTVRVPVPEAVARKLSALMLTTGNNISVTFPPMEGPAK